MQPIDPQDSTNQKATDALLEKSRALKEKKKLTNEKLNAHREQAEKMKDPAPQDQQDK